MSTMEDSDGDTDGESKSTANGVSREKVILAASPAPGSSSSLASAPVVSFDETTRTFILRLHEGTMLGTEVFASLLKVPGG
jgi:hypothetical protein